MLVEIYSDGSATTADKPGGYAWVLVVDGVKIDEGFGHLDKATNNVAEITAAIRGLERVESYLKTVVNSAAGTPGTNDVRVVLISDSQLVLRYATGEYQCRKYHLVPLYINLRRIFQKVKAETRWVRGHTGDKYNEECDVLAKAARDSTTGTSSQNKSSP